MSNLLDLTSSPASIILNIQEILSQIAKEHAETTDAAQRETLLALHHTALNIVQAQVQSNDLTSFLQNRSKHYRSLLIREAVDADGLADPEALERITAREIAAGRMREDDELRRLALEGAEAERTARREELASVRAQSPLSLWQRLRSAFARR